ncbi:O-methyltransferase [Olivibacter sitiensis]|uniref:O-methyltransferase n=1 Tax=Olivibacter sitiensis TaxID=376470 RepID=UPI0004099C09|nr:O-methyltransferase [Olivibacter sitiensis]
MNELLIDYLNEHCDAESSLLRRIDRETHLMETMPHMLSGHHQGRVLAFLSKLIQPKNILEIGTFTGYATLCLAEGLAPNGTLHSIDINEERYDRVSSYIKEAGLKDRIQLHIGDAQHIIPELTEWFDLVFIDADKKNNQHYYELVLNKIPSGGVILIDNVLWKGKVLEEAPDKQTKQVLQLNEYITKDERVEKVILPIRDGIWMIRKK